MPNTIVSRATTVWNGDLFNGSGAVSLDTSHAGTFDVAWPSRGEEAGQTTTPEELIGAAHATCYSMQFSNMLTENGTPPTRLSTGAEVSFQAGKGITGIHITVAGEVAGISAGDFEKLAETAKRTCPVSQALAGVDISLTASLS